MGPRRIGTLVERIAAVMSMSIMGAEAGGTGEVWRVLARCRIGSDISWMKPWDSNGDLEAMTYGAVFGYLAHLEGTRYVRLPPTAVFAKLTVSRGIGTSQHADAPSRPP